MWKILQHYLEKVINSLVLILVKSCGSYMQTDSLGSVVKQVFPH